MSDAPDIVLCSKLCRHNPADPSCFLFGRIKLSVIQYNVISSSRRGSRILKWGVNFCNNVIEPRQIYKWHEPQEWCLACLFYLHHCDIVLTEPRSTSCETYVSTQPTSRSIKQKLRTQHIATTPF